MQNKEYMVGETLEELPKDPSELEVIQHYLFLKSLKTQQKKKVYTVKSRLRSTKIKFSLLLFVILQYFFNSNFIVRWCFASMFWIYRKGQLGEGNSPWEHEGKIKALDEKVCIFFF